MPKQEDTKKRTSGCLLFSTAVGIILVLSSLLACGYTAYIYIRDQGGFGAEPASMHFVIDTKKLTKCPTGKVTAKQLPCMRSDTDYYTINDDLGPILCRDECNSNTQAVRSCRCRDNADKFNIVHGSVTLTSGGFYFIYGQISFKDNETSAMVAALQVNDRHSWTQCHQSRTQSSKSNHNCVINSHRRFKAGDRVSVYMPEAYRIVNADGAVTYWGIVRLTD